MWLGDDVLIASFTQERWNGTRVCSMLWREHTEWQVVVTAWRLRLVVTCQRRYDVRLCRGTVYWQGGSDGACSWFRWHWYHAGRHIVGSANSWSRLPHCYRVTHHCLCGLMAGPVFYWLHTVMKAFNQKTTDCFPGGGGYWADSWQHISTNSLYSAIHISIRWKYRTEDKLKTDITKTKHNTEKANNTKHSKTKLLLVQSPHTTLHLEMRWAYSTTIPSPHGATVSWPVYVMTSQPTQVTAGIRSGISLKLLLQL